MAARGAILLVMFMVMLSNAATRGTIQLAMAVMMLRPGRSWDDSACDVRGDVNAAARGAILLAMAVVIHKRGRSWDVSACNDHRIEKTEPLVGRSNSQRLPRFINVAVHKTIP